MANPYSITGSFSNPLTAAQVNSIVNANISSTALTELNKALGVADGVPFTGTPDDTKHIFNLTFDTAGGTQTSGTPTSPTQGDVPVFFADSTAPTTLTLTGGGPQIVVGSSDTTVGALTVVGSGGPQTMIGGAGPANFSAGSAGGAHYLEGGSGGSTLTGGTGADTLYGGLYTGSADTLYAGTGVSQRLNVGQGNNHLFADSTTSGVSDTLIGGFSGNDTLTGSGSMKDHTYFSIGYGTANTTVTGGAGKDSAVVFKGSGLTSIDGGAGKNDVTFIGQKFSDAVIKPNHDAAGNHVPGLTTIEFGGTTQVVELTNVQKVTFSDGAHSHTIKI